MKMAWRLVEVCGGDPRKVRPEFLATLDREFPDVYAALEALARMGRRAWTEAELDELRRLYPHCEIGELARHFARPRHQIFNRAAYLGLKKTRAHRRRAWRRCGHQVAAHPASHRTRFKPGQLPLNAGVKGYDAGGRSHRTRFKKGHRPHTWRPVGTETVDGSGYRRRKVCEDGDQWARWPYVHHLVWEEAHGPIPEGHALVFRDGNRANCELGNLELVTRAELARRNSIHNLPPEIKGAIYAKARLLRAIREEAGSG